jgi:hypothetical protein
MRKKTEQIVRPRSVQGAMKEVHGKASLMMMTNSGSKGLTHVSRVRAMMPHDRQ